LQDVFIAGSPTVLQIRKISGLSTIPVKLRLEILSLGDTLQPRADGSDLPYLKAVKINKRLYQEALEIYIPHTSTITQNNEVSLSKVPLAAMHGMKYLTIAWDAQFQVPKVRNSF